ncbi:uncharacterized protein PGTG_19940 [Puccinia graminis f. sp. tritici CRL 75-36-700-3]|uniref:Uncharacterized protein n=1 Tax=Puccinia graminis f. sp. tritici (strain CRL 75-36-700-3 / race SCCL) TaxID=418459 RepID=E3LBR4_PUCGT|nr:uncharacterized protein PGTG_19940 [Puccinia graminis f. sp. tritici CRL 75-36-700-3]EFP93986.1 hypothetical protein PGTG_19940 [Puccinia graminis f. sp. tritici CRL 75-36-700-3]
MQKEEEEDEGSAARMREHEQLIGLDHTAAHYISSLGGYVIRNTNQSIKAEEEEGEEGEGERDEDSHYRARGRRQDNPQICLSSSSLYHHTGQTLGNRIIMISKTRHLFRFRSFEFGRTDIVMKDEVKEKLCSRKRKLIHGDHHLDLDMLWNMCGHRIVSKRIGN